MNKICKYQKCWLNILNMLFHKVVLKCINASEMFNVSTLYNFNQNQRT
jgi:hypothetical protein